NPHDNSVIAEVAEARPRDIDRAVEAARDAFPVWKRMAASDRGRLLGKLADAIEADGENLAYLESIDTGHPLRDTEVWTSRARLSRFVISQESPTRSTAASSQRIRDFSIT